MKKEVKLVNKIKLLLRKAKIPRFLHHYGPKKYEFYQHAISFLVKENCKLSFRRVSKLLMMLGFKVPSYSALAKMRKRMPFNLWQLLHKLSVNIKHVNVAAMDSSGFTRSLPSWHYIERAGIKKRWKNPVQLSILIETRRKKILALRLRSKKVHDIKDARYLLKHNPIKTRKLVADKAYDAEWLHRLAVLNGITAIIPRRKGAKKGFHRKRMRFNKKIYHRRVMVESTFSSLKRKFSSELRGRTMQTQRAEIYCRAILHNLFFYCLVEIFN